MRLPCFLGQSRGTSFAQFLLFDVVSRRRRSISQTANMMDISLVGLTFSGDGPDDLAELLSLTMLDNVTVDQMLFDSYSDEFNAFAAMEGNTVTVVPGLCDVNRDGRCDVADIDAMTQNVVAGVNHKADHVELIKRPMPHGFGTYLGDANLDGEFNSGDLVAVFEAGKYEQDVVASWSEGDWDADGRFGTGDLVAAFQDGGYEQGPRPVAAVPEPASTLILLAGLIGFGSVSRTRRERF